MGKQGFANAHPSASGVTLLAHACAQQMLVCTAEALLAHACAQTDVRVHGRATPYATCHHLQATTLAGCSLCERNLMF